MATKKKTTETDKARNEAEHGTGLERDKGYGGTGDYANGQLTNSDPAQATEEQLREDRVKQRGV
jgi:hypothetical protein